MLALRMIIVFAHIGELDLVHDRGYVLGMDQSLKYSGLPGHHRFENNYILLKGR